MSPARFDIGTHPTPRQTLVRTLSLAGIVLIVGGTGIAMRSLIPTSHVPLGSGSPPDRRMTMFVSELQMKPSPASGASGDVMIVRLEGGVAANYPRMDASEVDARFAIFATPRAHDCCWLPRRITWHDDAAKGEVALPIAYVPTIKADVANVDFDGISQIPISKNEATWLRPMLLSHVPAIATIDLGAPDRPRLFDLRAATDAEIVEHQRARALASRN